ncbi:MAG: LysR family transcriptional regulator [Gluconacetobacter diazotrophicus]|nr:LysR family transcriptional regulator [Gluconacetobacter diazotrophicus]
MERGGFGAAAAHLHLSQSAVSHAVKALEQALGAPLLRRGNRSGIVLTPAGTVALAQARLALTAIERMAAHVGEAAGAPRLSGTLRIGVVQSAAVHLLPRWLRLLRADHPDVVVVLHEGTDPEVVDWVRAGVVEVGVTSRTHAALVARVVHQDEYVVLVPDRHPLARRTHVGLPDLDGHRMLLSGGGCETLIEELLASAGSNPDIACLVRDNATLASMVRGGLGLTIMPDLALPDERQGLNVIPLRPIMRRTLHVLTQRPALLGPLALAFLAVIGSGVDEKGGSETP